MAGTITQLHDTRGHVRKVMFTCVADAADGSFPDTVLSQPIEGRLVALVTNPGATAPTANYDITIEDQHGADVLQGAGLNRHTSTTERVPVVYSGTSLHPVVDDSDTLTLKIVNNAVNGAQIVIELLYAIGA